MKKIYITPVISFEELEDELMTELNKFSTLTINKQESPSETLNNDINIFGEKLEDKETWDDWDNDD